MRHLRLLAGVGLAFTSALALAQNSPESLLPPGFDEPAPTPTPTPAPKPTPRAAPVSRGPATTGTSSTSMPVVEPLPGAPSAPDDEVAVIKKLQSMSLDDIQKLSPEELEQLLGIKPKYDIPPAARRSMKRVGLIDASEGGVDAGGFAKQNVSLVRAALTGNSGQLVSRWGHILLRRVLASRLDAPEGMNPADFTAMRAALLLRMGEADAARALVQDVDTGNYTPDLIDTAFDAYIATADFTGMCPSIFLFGNMRRDPQWEVASEICRAFQGDGNAALAGLDHDMARGIMPRIDLLLAEKYAGAAGRARRVVNIEWKDVKGMTPWRYGLTIAVGLYPPDSLMKDAGPHYDYTAATAPMLGLERRAAAADRAGAAGILSSAAMVDLYSQIYVDSDVTSVWAQRAAQLRDAYLGSDPQARLAAMKELWSSAKGPDQRYSRQVLTAYAAARLPVEKAFAADAPALITSMLTAGLDGNAMRWASVVERGSQGWALLALAGPSPSALVKKGDLDTYIDNDKSDAQRKSAFLLAGLAGLGRITPKVRDDVARKLAVGLTKQTRWSTLIDQAANVRNPALVAVLAGVGMQGDSWAKMTPRYLFHIVSDLHKVGLDAEARMIAAEAVARG